MSALKAINGSLPRFLNGICALSAREARGLLGAIVAASPATATAREQAAQAFHASHIPFARLIARVLSLPDDRLFSGLADLRPLLGSWLVMVDRDDRFWRAIENLLAESLIAGMRSLAAIRASSLEEILDRSSARSVLPTSLGSADLSRLSLDIREASIFSARTTNADYLAEQARVIDDFLAGRINTTTARFRLLKTLDRLGYTPETGFPGDEAFDVPAADPDSLQDLSSDRRIQLILDTQAELAFGKGQQIAGRETRDMFPAWELVRLKIPKGDPRDWPSRWEEAGGDLLGPSFNRMLALQDAPIWTVLGHEWDDSLSTDHPPFAFNSGMGWRAVEWTEALELGLVDADSVAGPQPSEPRFPDRPPVRTENFPPDLAEQLQAELARAQADAQASMARDLEAARRAAR